MTTERHVKTWACVAALTAAGALGVGATSAGAVTIGQLAPEELPNGPANSCNTFTTEWVTPAPGNGVSYAVPQFGTRITSWSTRTNINAGVNYTFKVYRNVPGFPSRYTVVGRDGPRGMPSGALAINQVQTFPVNIAVAPGDLIGLRTNNGLDSPCLGTIPGLGPSYYFQNAPDIPDGGFGDFALDPNADRGLNETADVVVEPPVAPAAAAAGPTGQRAAALKKCAKIKNKKKKKKCKKRARKLPV
jgi:hypothetical protein